MSKNCGKCNYQNEEHSNFCQGCGSALTQPTVPEVSQAGSMPPPVPETAVSQAPPPVPTTNAPPVPQNTAVPPTPPIPAADIPPIPTNVTVPPVPPVSTADNSPMPPVPTTPPLLKVTPLQQTSAQDVEENKLIAALAYFVFFLPLLACKDSAFGRFHANQSLVLLLAWIVVFISGSVIPILGWFLILPFGSIAIIVLGIMGIINALNGEMKELPLIGKIVLLS